MKNDIDVSIIVPVYNAEKYLDACLAGLVNQTQQNIEIICVNDGSDDNSDLILKDYQNKYHNKVKVVNRENGGSSAARNTGLLLAKGKYVIFLDADDIFDKSLIEKTYTRAEKTAADIVIFNIYKFDNKSGEQFEPAVLLNKRYLPSKEVFSVNDIPDYILNISLGVAWNKLYRKAFIDENQLQFQEIKNSNSVYFALTSLVLAKKISVVDERLLYYRCNNPKSLVGTVDTDPCCFLRAWDKIREKLINEKYFEKIKRSYVNAACMYACRRLSEIKNYYVFCKVYERIKNEFIPSMNVNGLQKDYYHSADTYEWINNVMKFSSGQYILSYNLKFTETDLYNRV